MVRTGYTLPVFACAAAVAALKRLQSLPVTSTVRVDLLEPAETATLLVEQVALIAPEMALAITRSDPGDNLDLTRNTPIWATVQWGTADQEEAIQLVAGEGIGYHLQDQTPAIYAYANRLLRENLSRCLTAGQKIRVTLILPEGRSLAARTSNAAFGVVEGLSLLGTSGIAHPLSAPGQLELFRQDLQQKANQFETLVLCIGENGLDLAQQLGIPNNQLVKTANWLGPLLVEAGIQGVKAVLLFGYHGKLIKLAGGIFHTHHHLADGRLEIFTAQCAKVGIPIDHLQRIMGSPTVEAAWQYLQQQDQSTGYNWATTVYQEIARTIDQRSQEYIQTHCDRSVTVGSILFDRSRKIIMKSVVGTHLLERVLARLE